MGHPDYALSSCEFDVLWGQLCVGRIPYLLGVPRTGPTPREDTAVTDEVYRELIDRGLVAPDRQVDAGLAEFLHLLDTHRVSVDLVGDFGYPVRALAVTDGQRGVLAMRAGGELWLTRVQPAGLVAAVVGLLPNAAPVPRGAGGNNAGLELLRRDMVSRPEAALHCGVAGRIGISIGDGEPMPVLVACFDIDSVRYLLVREETRLYIGPADSVEIERRVCALLPALG